MLELLTMNSLLQGEVPSMEKFTNSATTGITIVTGILILLIACLTAYLAWSCHTAGGSKFHRFLISAFAFLFSFLYLIYYFLRFIVFGEDCPGRKGSK